MEEGHIVESPLETIRKSQVVQRPAFCAWSSRSLHHEWARAFARNCWRFEFGMASFTNRLLPTMSEQLPRVELSDIVTQASEEFCAEILRLMCSYGYLVVSLDTATANIVNRAFEESNKFFTKPQSVCSSNPALAYFCHWLGSTGKRPVPCFRKGRIQEKQGERALSAEAIWF